jgi:hypothetical protein
MGSLTLRKSMSLRRRVKLTSGAISRSISSRRFSCLELSRLAEDLEVSRSRLKSREYKQSSFKARNSLSIPDRTEEIAKDLKFYWSVASVWREIIRATFGVTQVSVAEVGCGHISKIGLGLIYSDFNGQLTLVDTDVTASKRAVECLSYFGARFLVAEDHSSIIQKSTKKFDAILSNHFLDDLILSTYCEQNSISLDSLYACEQFYRQVWNEIVHCQENLPSLAKSLAQNLNQKLNTKGLLLMLDYPSFSHKAMSLSKVIILVKSFRELLKKELCSLGLVQFSLTNLEHLHFDRLTINSQQLLAFRKET